MAVWCPSPPEFQRNDRVVSLVYHHPPEVEPGTKGTIVSPQIGSLYAVQLPNGELHRWFAGFELEPVNSYPNYFGLLYPGSFAKILTSQGHPPTIKPGMIVRIIKVISQVPFYDLMIDGKGYHRWLADFELVSLNVVCPKE
ncbi:hypothetical protein [Clostridium lundense]|uniref:hypothetical protein n=1 Tax=Clostridium lundense TaxID=319475 RepID=UPI0004894423|nr:hypothetical protein [Clostridium lundense]